MAERVLEALSEIARKHPDDTVLVVTSGGPIRVAQAHAQGIDQAVARLYLERAENCALVELEIEGDSFSLNGAS